MGCYSCRYKGDLKNSRIKIYPYKESGLPNVFLVNVPAVKCPQCGVEIPDIVHPEKLHEMIAESIVRKKFLLNAHELRFVRTQLGYSQTDFANKINFNNSHLNRVENEKESVSDELDRLVRVFYLKERGTPKRSYEALHNALEEAISKKDTGEQSYRYRLKSEGKSWNLEKAA